MAEADEFDGEPASASDMLRACAVLANETGKLEDEYPVGVCEVISSTGEPIRVALICVGEKAGTFLVAVPQTAWHRIVARRRLPSSFLAKPMLCDVAVAPSRDPAAASENSKLWL